MKPSIFLIIFAVVLACFPGCRQPEKIDLKTYFPAETLAYMETADLGKVTAVFTEKVDGKAAADHQTDLSFLKGKSAALAITGVQSSGENGVLQVKPKLVLAIDTGLHVSQASLMAESMLKTLARKFFTTVGEVGKSDLDGVAWASVHGEGEKKIFSAVSGGVVLVGNDREAIQQCLDIYKTKAPSFTGGPEPVKENGQTAAPAANDEIARGYISPAGVKELSGYLGVSYAIKSSENTVVRGMVSGLLPQILQKTVTSIAWSAKATNGGVEDTYLIRTEKEFAAAMSQTVKAGTAQQLDTAFVSADTYSASYYSLEQPQIAWRGAVLSLAKKMDSTELPLFEELSKNLLKSYGIDDPEMFLSAVGPQFVAVRFDAEGNEAAAIVKVTDIKKLKESVSVTFGAGTAREIVEGVEIWKSGNGEFAAAFANEYVIVGATAGVLKCLRSGNKVSVEKPVMPEGFQIAGAVINTRQQDDAAKQILASAVSEDPIEQNFNSFTETRIEPDLIKRRTHSRFGLFGEIFQNFK